MKLTPRSAISAAAGALALVVLAACSSVTVNTDWNSSLDFTQYKTFAFLPDTVDTDLPAFSQQRLTAAITAELVKHGLTQVAADPQLYVTYRAKRSSTTQYTTVSTGYGYGAGWGGWGGYGYGGYGGVGVSTTSAQQIPMGNLIVVLVDPKLNQMVWRSNAKAELSDDQQGRAQQLQSAMAQMFQQFPPKKGEQPGATGY